MARGVFRRSFIGRRRLHAVATFTAPAAAAGVSLPLVRRSLPYHVYRRFYPVIHLRRRSIAGLPNADAKIAPPIQRRRPPYSVYLTPPPPIARRSRSTAGLPNADVVVGASLPLARRHLLYSVYRRVAPPIVRRSRSIAGLPKADAVNSLPLVRRRPPYSVYLTPPPPIVRLLRRVIGLPKADSAKVTQKHGEIFSNKVSYRSDNTDPGVTDDEDSNFRVTSIWINTGDGGVFICTDPLPGAAVWVKIGPTV